MARSTIDGDSRTGVADRLLYGRTDTRLRAVWRVLAPLAVGIGIYALGHTLVGTYGATSSLRSPASRPSSLPRRPSPR